MTHVRNLIVVASLVMVWSAPVGADTTITVDGDLSDWPEDGFDYLDPAGDQPPPWGDIVHVWATDDNASGSDGNLYLAIEFYEDFRETVGSNDVDVYVYLDIDGDGQIGGPEDRIVEVTEGTITDGDGNLVGSIGSMAYDGTIMEIAIPYDVLGLEHGDDSFGLATGVTGKPPDDVDLAPDEGAGDDGFIVYDGTQEPEPRSVLLADLAAVAGREGVTLHWTTGSERANAGFHVYRLGRRGQRVRLTAVPVAGLGNAPVGRAYRWFDRGGGPGDRYLVEDLGLDGRRRLHGPVFAGTNDVPPAPVRPSGATRNRRPAAPAPARPGGTIKLAVEHEGLVRIPRGWLEAGGLDPRAVANGKLRLLRRGRAVAVIEDGDGIRFVGVPVRDRYAGYEVLHARRGPAFRMPARRVTRRCTRPVRTVDRRLEIAEDHVYHLASPVADKFYWAQAFEGYPAMLAFDLPGLEGSPHAIRLDVTGMAPAHRIEVALNGTVLGMFDWSGGGLEALELTVPAGLLAERGNLMSVRVLATGMIDLVLVEGIRLVYQRRLEPDRGRLAFATTAGQCIQIEGLSAGGATLLDVTDPHRPVRLQGYRLADGKLRFRDRGLPGSGAARSYLLVEDGTPLPVPRYLGEVGPRDLASPSLGADYLVVSHPDFLQAAGRLAAFHAGRGLATLVVGTDEVYDCFGDGRPAPDAIRALIRTAQTTWHTPPRFVLLAGGSTVDPRGFLPGSPPDLLPAAFVTTARGYEAASDGWYVTGEDGLPLAAVGRLAVESPEEAQAVVDKTIEAHAQMQAPLGRALFVADDYDPDSPEPATEFEVESDALITACLPAEVELDRLYKAQVSDPAGALRARVEQGVDLINYMGHAYLSGWSSGPVLVDTTAAGLYQNERFFLLLSWSCFDGAFVGPWAESLAWGFMRNPQGGAAAALAASSLSEPEALRTLAGRLLCLLTSGESPTIGEALRRAARELSGGPPALADLLATFNLLGDPALPNPWTSSTH